ncbi:hypothetical protein BN77_p40080 [Rhizobium mesoamericanum STM3625]|uniref:Uncharacterized protein n=1 Tax=Rhizobium mesoamericanum STM3625 TaxID=1211777 RepID=K0Q446_9HYPH|nr:hypothetical protein BN77_p40080 [Rhizobium mesoamericanum STM3625]
MTPNGLLNLPQPCHPLDGICSEPNWADLAVELKKPGVTLLILWEEYRGSHPDGYGYSRYVAAKFMLRKPLSC